MKQNEVLSSDVHLVEVDLLRGGLHVLAVPLTRSYEFGDYDYLTNVNRAEGRRERFEVYPTLLANRLPRIRIPLADDDPDVALDVQAVLAQVYEAGSYAHLIDYGRPCKPPLQGREAAWAEELIREAGDVTLTRRRRHATIAAMNVIVVVCNSLHSGSCGAYGNWLDRDAAPRPARRPRGSCSTITSPRTSPRSPPAGAGGPAVTGFPTPKRLDPAPARRGHPARPALEPGGPHGLDLGRAPAARGGQRVRTGFDEVVWVRGQGYDPLVPAGRPADQGQRPVADEPGLRLPAEDDPDSALWKGRWEQFLRNRAVLRTDLEENTGVARTVRAAIDWLERRGPEKDPFLLWLDLFSPHGPWDPPAALPRSVRRRPNPTNSRPARKGDLVEDEDDDGPRPRRKSPS